MAARTNFFLSLFLVGLSICGAESQIEGYDHVELLQPFHLLSCMSYVVNGTKLPRPSVACCLSVAFALHEDHECICKFMEAAKVLKIPINATRLQTLPTTCYVSNTTLTCEQPPAASPSQPAPPQTSPAPATSPSRSAVTRDSRYAAPTPSASASPSKSPSPSQGSSPTSPALAPALSPMSSGSQHVRSAVGSLKIFASIMGALLILVVAALC